MSNERRGSATEWCAVYSLAFVLVGFRNSITTSLANDSDMICGVNALCVSTCDGIPVRKSSEIKFEIQNCCGCV